MKTEIKLEYNMCENAKQGIPVIVVAAGSSNRMNGINKQFIKLNGIPIIIRTLLAFEKSPCVSRIILVVRDQDIYDLQLLSEKYNISKLSDIVCGGDCRQASVLKGFERLKNEEDKLLIHDGARPFVSQKIIFDVTKKLETVSAAVCAVKPKDTLKQTDNNGKIIKDLHRESIDSMQTPQGVWKNDYLKAIKNITDLSAFTDDMAIMEAGGFDCFCVEGDYKNIKITTPEDILIAESFLKEELI